MLVCCNEVIANVRFPHPQTRKRYQRHFLLQLTSSLIAEMEGKGQSRAAKRRKKQAAKTGHSQPQLSAPKAAAPLPSSQQQQQQQQVKKQKPSRADSAAGRPLMEIVRDGSLQGKEKASQLLAQLIAPHDARGECTPCVERLLQSHICDAD
jgi:hypothetical protein